MQSRLELEPYSTLCGRSSSQHVNYMAIGVASGVFYLTCWFVLWYALIIL
jgi:hypothetical protein